MSITVATVIDELAEIRRPTIYLVETPDKRFLLVCGPCHRDGLIGSKSRRAVLNRAANGAWQCQLCGAR